MPTLIRGFRELCFRMSSFLGDELAWCCLFLTPYGGDPPLFRRPLLEIFLTFFQTFILIEAPDMTSDVVLGDKLGCIDKTKKWR